MNILLIFPPSDYPGKRHLFPPLGLLYVGTALENKGYQVSIIDFNIDTYDDQILFQMLSDQHVVGISTYNYNYQNAEKIAKIIKNMRNNIFVISGGPEYTLRPRLPEGVDIVVTGEAEMIINEIMDGLLLGKNLSDCPNILFKDQKTGTIHISKELTKISDINHISFPNRALIKSENYSTGLATMITTRGCPNRCKFCTRNIIAHNKYRERDIDNVLNEIRQISKAGYKVLVFIDDDLFANPKRLSKIMDGIIEHHIDLEIIVQGGTKNINEKMLMIMKTAGVKAIIFGIESGNQKVLDFYNKRTTIKQNKKAVQMANHYGFYTIGFFILGAPFETEKDMTETIHFAYELPLDFVGFAPLQYMYGSHLWDEAYKNGFISETEYCVTADVKRGLGRLPADILKEICYGATTDFYKRPAYLERINQKIKTSDITLTYNILKRHYQ